jgi:hypothetical protein
MPAKSGSVLDVHATRSPIALPDIGNGGIRSDTERERGGKGQAELFCCFVHVFSPQ